MEISCILDVIASFNMIDRSKSSGWWQISTQGWQQIWVINQFILIDLILHAV